MKVFCSSGTYTRTLARNLSGLIARGATVKTLRRDVIGVFDVKNALSFDDLKSSVKIMEKLMPYEKLLELTK
jgi:tRNA U55 pseudouridine synthase TruB